MANQIEIFGGNLSRMIQRDEYKVSKIDVNIQQMHCNFDVWSQYCIGFM